MSDQQEANPAALSLRKIALHEGVSQSDLERCMLEEPFPSTDVSEVGVFTPTQHFLLEEPSRVYVWMCRVEYLVHATRFPAFLDARLSNMYENAQGKLEPFGTYTEDTLDVYVDVATMPIEDV